MKKTLLLISCSIFMFGSLLTQAQNRISVPNRDKSNPTKLRVQSAVTPQSANKNAPQMLTTALSGIYVEGFEGVFPPAGWQVIDVQDPTFAWAQSAAFPFEGTQSAYMSYTSTIGVTGEDWLIMPQFTVASTDSVSFWLAPEFLPYPPDTTLILISTTDSATTSFTTVLGTLAEGLNYPTTQSYSYYSFPLAAFAGQDIWVAFVNINDYGDGIFIDKVTIGTPAAGDISSLTIDMPAYTAAGVSTSPLATVQNVGSATQTFDVTMTITGGYTSTKTVTALGAGATQQITFDPWVPVVGTAVITTTTLLVGDANPTNDVISQSINVMDPFVNFGWISKANLPDSFYDPAMASVNTNDTSYLFHMGGATLASISVDLNKYAPYSNSWSALTGLTTGSYVAGGAGVNNKLYFIGGYNPNFSPIADNQIYDLATSSWSSGAPMPTPVGDFAIGVYNNNYIYCIAGYDGTGDQTAVQIYNTSTNTWTTGTPYPYPSAGLRGGITGNKIVVSGGYNQTIGAPGADTYVGTIDATNPGTITWTQVADYPSGPISRHGGAASLDVASGLVVFTGGDPSGTGTEARSETFGYDVISNSWKIGPAKLTAVNNIGNMAAIVDNDSLYLASIGGYDGVNPSDVHEWLNLGAYQIPTGINENDNVYGIDAYPNPLTDETTITVSLTKTSNVKVVIFDVLGNELSIVCDKELSQGINKLNWDATTFAKGVYFCNIVVDGKTFTQKIVKM